MSDSQERLEAGNDPVNKIRKLMEKWKNRLTLDNLRLAERYINGDLHFIAHLTTTDALEFCAVFEKWDSRCFLNGELGGIEYWRIDPLFRHFSPIPLSACHPDDNVLISGSAHEQQLVLVGNVEIVEQPEIVVPSVVRLQSVNETYRSLAHSLYLSRRIGFVFGSRFRDRETGLLSGNAVIGLNELPRQMVKGTPQIVDNIADNAGELGRNWRPNLDSIDPLCGMRASLGSDSIWFSFPEGVEPSIKLADVVFGPFDFNPDA